MICENIGLIVGGVILLILNIENIIVDIISSFIGYKNCWLGLKATKYANITNMPPI